MKNILLVGGAGYVGSELCTYLLKKNFNVSVFDLFIYGETLPKNNKNLHIIKGDIRNLKLLKKNIKNIDIVIHLACISNDPSFDLNPDLGRSINFECFEPLIKLCKDYGVKKFIYASSSSVYGVKNEMHVTEESMLEPLTDYSKYKAMCEDVIKKHVNNSFVCTIIRPATVCGYSKRQRLDLVVNILTNNAYNKGEIEVYGGKQLRPNINIKDMCRAYYHLIMAEDKLINGQIFNIGIENLSVLDLAEKVRKNINPNIKIKILETDDNRSYHISSKKFSETLNFSFKYTIEDAINDLKFAFQNKLLHRPLENEVYFNIKRMKSLKLI
jgi:nucleoside-diphosphate-sugar epimerase